MISAVEFSKWLAHLGVNTTVGVPDSTFKGLISYFSSQSLFRHLIAVNECEAMGIAAGYYLASQKPALVYMQNSGFCKTLNPYTSLLSPDAYGIPALMLVGWRGEPGKKDEPQHIMMGRILIDLLTVLELEYTILEEDNWKVQLEEALSRTIQSEKPYVVVVRNGLFDDYKVAKPVSSFDTTLTREQALEIIVNYSPEQAVFISTTGKTSRELFEIRKKRSESHGKDFYTVGSMGCASAIALGVGLVSSPRTIFILDGDGAALMQLGTLATIGHYKNPRLKHIIIDNNAHESTGGQPTVSDNVNFMGIGKACGYDTVMTVDCAQDLATCLQDLETNNRLSLVVVKVKTGSRSDLGRPTTTPKENRDAFIQHFTSQ